MLFIGLNGKPTSKWQKGGPEAGAPTVEMTRQKSDFPMTFSCRRVSPGAWKPRIWPESPAKPIVWQRVRPKHDGRYLAHLLPILMGSRSPHLTTTVIVPFHRNLEQLARSLPAVRRSMPEAEILVAADGQSTTAGRLPPTVWRG